MDDETQRCGAFAKKRNIPKNSWEKCKFLSPPRSPDAMNKSTRPRFSLKHLTLMLTFCCCNLLTAAQQHGHFTYDDLGYSLAISGFAKDASGHVEIPPAIDGKPVTQIGAAAFQDCTSISSINIPPGVTTIGDSAFSGCFDLSSLTIPPSVTSLGKEALSLCLSLTAVTLPPNLTAIEDFTFSFCVSLRHLTMPTAVTQLGFGAFVNCPSLKSILFLGDAPAPDLHMLVNSNEATLYRLPGTTGWSSDNWAPYTLTTLQEPETARARWLGEHGFDPASTDLDSDPNADGVSLLTAYALDLDPHQQLRGSLPKTVSGSDSLSLTFFAGRSDITYSVQTTTDLRNWTTEGVTLSELGPDNTRTARVPRDTAFRFVRLVLEAVPEEPVSPLVRWLLTHGFSPESDLRQDPNEDGVTLEAAYALNLDPHRDLTSSLPVPTTQGNTLSMTYYAGRPDLTYIVQTSTDLENWETVGVTLSPGSDHLITASVVRDAPSRFLRLVID